MTETTRICAQCLRGLGERVPATAEEKPVESDGAGGLWRRGEPEPLCAECAAVARGYPLAEEAVRLADRQAREGRTCRCGAAYEALPEDPECCPECEESDEDEEATAQAADLERALPDDLPEEESARVYREGLRRLADDVETDDLIAYHLRLLAGPEEEA